MSEPIDHDILQEAAQSFSEGYHKDRYNHGKLAKARKAHWCQTCSTEIKPGRWYVRSSVLIAGKGWKTLAFCVHCAFGNFSDPGTAVLCFLHEERQRGFREINGSATL